MGGYVEIVDVAQAVAAEAQRIEQRADAVFADVEGVAAEAAAPRVAVGHDHFGERGTAHDRAQPVAVVIADVMEDQPLADIEADAKLPLLPAYQMAFDSEARALGLPHLERLEVGPQSLRETDRAGIGRQGNDPEVVHAQHPAPPQIDDRMQVGDRAGIRVVAGFVGHPALAVGYSFALLAGEAEVAGRPRLDENLFEIRDAPLAAGLLESRVSLGDAAAFDKFIHDDARLDPGNVSPADEFALRKIDQPGERAVARRLVAARHRRAGSPAHRPAAGPFPPHRGKSSRTTRRRRARPRL